MTLINYSISQEICTRLLLCCAFLCCYVLTDLPISIRLTSLALWQSDDCPSASKATLMNMDKHFIWIHYERLHNHNKAKHNKTVCIFLGIYCMTLINYYIHIKLWDVIALHTQTLSADSQTAIELREWVSNRTLQELALLTLSWNKNWDSHSLVNGYPSFYPRIALVASSPEK